MPAADPAGGQKFWQPGAGTFETLGRTGKDPGSQQWWMPAPALTLDGLVGSGSTPPGPGTPSTFPALTVAP